MVEILGEGGEPLVVGSKKEADEGLRWEKKAAIGKGPKKSK